MTAFAKKPLFHAMQIQEPSRYASLHTPFDDLQKEVVRNRKKISDVKDAVDNWRKNGGEELRAFYQDILDKSSS
ncbi:hypothetical protein AB0442_15860 [Kitasatospora sp. NPDC085895]|uniref:hypothetical protein n=1 Tax=Kitasatospora sp. NPDC085895 TaxID=3155057 RepID=UPI00344CB7D3